MKKLVVGIMMSLFSSLIFSQPTKEDYLQKSRNQKKAARIVITGGTVIAGIGLGLTMGNLNGLFDPNSPGNSNDGTAGDILGYSGLAIMATSIPLFIAASKNKKKAMRMSFENQLIPQLRNSNFVYRVIPSFKLTMTL